MTHYPTLRADLGHLAGRRIKLVAPLVIDLTKGRDYHEIPPAHVVDAVRRGR